MRYAVCGLGFISKRHINAISNVGGTVAMTCDIDPSKNADYRDWVEMFRSPAFKQVDAVAVCTPNYTHSAIVREAVRLGKKVICEKPLTIFGDTQGMDGAKVVLQLRYNPRVQRLKRELKGNQNQIDIKVRTFREESYFKSWKGDATRSGGILYNMGVHYIDLLEHLLGEPECILETHYEERLAWGRVRFQKGIGTYHIELSREQGVNRTIQVNGRVEDLEGATIPLTDTGEALDLHTQVYKAFERDKGIGVSEARKSLELVEELKGAI